MSDKGKPQRRGEKKYFTKSHPHKPKKGKDSYRKKGKHNMRQVDIEELIEEIIQNDK